MVDLAIANLRHDRLRFLATVLGVAFAVCLVFVQVGLFIGLLDSATITIRRMGADLWVTSRRTPAIDFAHPFPESHVQRIRSVPGVVAADNLIVWFVYIYLPTGAHEGTVVYAMEDFSRWGIPWSVTGGDVRDLRRGPYFFLDQSAARRFGPFRVGDYREFLGHRMQLIGTTREARSFTTTPIAFMDYRRAQVLYPGIEGQTTYVVVKVAPGADVEAVRREIARRLPHNDVFTTAEWAQKSHDYWIDTTGIGLNMYVTVLLGCLVGVVVVAQTIYTSTMEHLKEFGTLKALGGSNRSIYGILARQASVAAVCGFVVGAVPSYAIRPLMGRIDLKLIIEPGFAVYVMLGSMAMCLLAAMLSFHKVASIDPATVFRS